MIEIQFEQPDGRIVRVEAAAGLSLMEVAVKNGVEGIDADCGGQCACATCHVFILGEWFDRLPPKGEMEEAMLENAEDVGANSRLACQIEIGAQLDGLTVRMPASQF